MNCTEIEIFVAPDGNDGGPGDRAKPFRTLARARDAIRELKRAARLTGAVTVWLRGGRYPLAEPLLFTPEDSAPVTFAAWPGDKSGKETLLRTHWNNQTTGIVNDEVFELRMEPKNWGELEFRN